MDKKYFLRVFDERDVAVFSAVCFAEDVHSFLQLFENRDDVKVRLNILTDEVEK